MASINPGEFRTLIEFQRLTPQSDGAGGTTAKLWATVFTCWAKIEPQDGSRYSDQSQMLTGNVYKLTTYVIPAVYAITAKDRIKLQTGELLTIHSMVNDGFENHFLRIIAHDGK